MTEEAEYDEREWNQFVPTEPPESAEAPEASDASVPALLPLGFAARAVAGSGMRRARKSAPSRRSTALAGKAAPAPRRRRINLDLRKERLRQQQVATKSFNALERLTVAMRPLYGTLGFDSRQSLPERLGEIALIRLRLMQYPSVADALSALERSRRRLETSVVTAGREPARDEPRLTPGDNPLPIPEELWRQLAELTPPQRLQISEQALAWMTRIVRSGWVPTKVLRAELAELGEPSAIVDLSEYRQLRSEILGTFGTLARANKYYKAIQGNPPVPGSAFFKFKSPETQLRMHPNLMKALTKAENWLVSNSYGHILDERFELSTYDIRACVNATVQLSPHSFGKAIDINATSSANIISKDLEAQGISDIWRMIRALTGGEPAAPLWISYYARDQHPSDTEQRQKYLEEFESLTPEQKHNAIFSMAQEMYDTSKKLVQLFAAKPTDREKPGSDVVNRISAPTKNYLEQVGISLSIPQVEELLRRYVHTDAHARPDVDHELARLLTIYARAPQPGSEDNSMEPRDCGNPLTTEDPFLVPVAGTVIDISIAARYRPEDSKERNVRDLSLLQHADVWHVVANGFMGVPPEMVTALVSEDVGDLKWLGTLREGFRDSMHFELKQRPETEKMSGITSSDLSMELSRLPMPKIPTD